VSLSNARILFRGSFYRKDISNLEEVGKEISLNIFISTSRCHWPGNHYFLNISVFMIISVFFIRICLSSYSIPVQRPPN